MFASLDVVLLVNDTAELKEAALTSLLSSSFKCALALLGWPQTGPELNSLVRSVRHTKAQADYIIPGISTVALAVLHEADVMFEYKRQPALERQAPASVGVRVAD